MIYSIISENDIFYTPASAVNSIRSSNPYDYIRQGYYLDNASLYGGKDYVDFNCNFSGNRTGNYLDIPGV
ncbi:MAG: hypothetical protein J1E36_03375 [Eubacterium sp.]|nr:hypothetical protein [Eubacterium sp.]